MFDHGRFTAVALAATLLCAAGADAATLFENPSRNDGDGNCHFSTGCGIPPVDTFGAARFTLNSNSRVETIGFTAYTFDSQPLSVDWKILSDAGLPEAVLSERFGSSFSIADRPLSQYAYTIDNDDLSLSAGNYWVAFRVNQPNFDTHWSFSLLDNPLARSMDPSGTSWTPGYPGEGDMGGGAITITGIPLPASAYLLAAALGLLAVTRRRTMPGRLSSGIRTFVGPLVPQGAARTEA